MAATHSSAHQARQVLADRLREIRVHADLTGREHADRSGWHAAKTSRIENNRTAPSADDIRTWCGVCGVEDQADDLVASLRAVEGMFIEWRRMEGTGLHAAQQARMPLYERTRRFRAYSSWLIPGMIQTADYIEQVLRNTQRGRDLPDDLDQAVAARLERQRLLTDGSKRFAFVVEEAALRSGVTDAEVMTEQLWHLIEMAKLPNVSLSIAPTRVGRDQLPVEGFWIFDKAQVNVELVSGYLTVTQPREVEMYAETFARLAKVSVVGSEARERIAAAIDLLA